MPSAIEQIETIVTKAGDLVETKVDLWKLKATSKVSEATSSVLSLIAVVMLVSVALFILSFGVAYWIGSAMGKTSYGFFIVGGFYVLAGFFVFLFRESLIKKPISNLIIDKFIK
jgi:Putative Actinobacterial Holin-X, holin superfamily III